MVLSRCLVPPSPRINNPPDKPAGFRIWIITDMKLRASYNKHGQDARVTDKWLLERENVAVPATAKQNHRYSKLRTANSL